LIKDADRIKNIPEIEIIAARAREQGLCIVFTNGCFDILHVGHAKYLEIAKELGDVLIVGVNSDESVKRLKGDLRPINDSTDRAGLIAALRSVDYVVIFEEDTPYELIRVVRPSILVKGGDYRGGPVVGDDLVNEVKIVDFFAGKSTTNIVTKIKGTK